MAANPPALQRIRVVVFVFFGLVLAMACAPDESAPLPNDAVASLPEIPLRLALAAPMQVVDARFLSVAVDSSEMIGGMWWAPYGAAGGAAKERVSPYDFTRPRLRRLARELAPAYLRLGGTEADVIFYDMSGTPVTTPPPHDSYVMTHTIWDSANQFAIASGFDVLFTLNAGPGARDAHKNWRPDNARALMEYTAGRQYPVRIWELGNEVNAYLVTFGLFSGVSGAQYAHDMATLRTLANAAAPGALIAGPASAYWPAIGELPPLLPSFLEHGGRPDVVTWHFYPQQSRRCPIATQPASPWAMLAATHLNEVSRWSQQVLALRNGHAPQAAVALGETGNAQCGGQPGLSDRFVSGLWWLDELGLMARAGQQFVVRQTLSGSDYGLIDDATLVPNPDYWNSLLWKRLMGPQALNAALPATDPAARAYAHCTPGRPGAVTALLLNLDVENTATFRVAQFAGLASEVYLLTAPDLFGKTTLLNGKSLAAAADGSPPPLPPIAGDRTGAFALPPASYAFVVFPEANAPACR